MHRLATLAAALTALSAAAFADFELKDDGKSLAVLENGQPALVYNYQPVAPPDDLDPKRWARSSYIHPLYGPDGDVLTQDFPPDHRHHRGLFWAWPHTHAGERLMDIWLHEDCEIRFERFVRRDAGPQTADVAVENAWVFKDSPDKPVVRESIAFTVHPLADGARAIDFHLAFRNVSDQPVSFLGATGKGYGGFCYRPDANRKDLRFTSVEGTPTEDKLFLETPWADASSRARAEGPFSGVAIFQHPANPGYPHPGWILRHYGFLGASWPHLETFVLPAGEALELRYRLFVHRGDAAEAKVADAFTDFEAEAKSPNAPK